MSGNLGRTRLLPGARKGLGLALAWLNLAVAPCALAFDAAHECPHVPPADMQAMHGHHGHAEVSEPPSCDSLKAECCDGIVASVDSRGQQDADDLQPGSPVLPCDHTDLAAAIPAAVDDLPPRPPDPPGAAPPRHVLFCVYLD